jgi:LEA14-like dessication related protein
MFAANKVQVLFLILMTMFFSNCASLTKDLLKNPEVKLNAVEVTGVTLNDVSMNLKLNVANPNPIPLSLNKVSYIVQFSGQKVTEGVFDKGIDIPASGSGELVVPLKFEYNALGSLVDGFLKKTLSKEYEVSGSATLGIFSIPFSKKGEIVLDRK